MEIKINYSNYYFNELFVELKNKYFENETTEVFAVKIGLTSATVIKILKGTDKCTNTSIDALLNRLNLTITKILLNESK